MTTKSKTSYVCDNTKQDKSHQWWKSSLRFVRSLNFRPLVCSSCRLAGLVVKASASGAEDPGSESPMPRDFSGSSHTSDLKIGTPEATLPGAWRYRVSAGAGRPGVGIL